MRRCRYDTRVDLSHGSTRRTVIAALGAVVLLANFFADLALAIQPSRIDMGFVGRALAGYSICLSANAATFDREGAGSSGDEQGELPGRGVGCVFCLPLLQAHLLPSFAGGAQLSTALLIASGLVVSLVVKTTGLDAGSHSSRGPPNA